MSGGSDFEQALRQFREDFARQLPARLDDARARLQACRDDPTDDDRLRELHRVLHKLAGSAGTFGMPVLGEQARAIEEQLDGLMARSGRTAADFDAIGPRIEALAGAAGAAA